MSIPSFSRNASDIAAEVLMTRSDFSGAIVLVEGAPDSRFLQRHLLVDDTQITICGGKEKAVRAMSLMAALPIIGYLAVVDRDYDDYKGIIPSQNVFYTDTHDVETLLLSLRLDTVVAEVGDHTKITDLQKMTGRSLADEVLDRAAVFAKLRFLNDVQPAFCISMSAFSPWKYIDKTSWVVDEHRLHADFADRCGHTFNELRTLVEDLPPLKSWRDAQGHDAVSIVSIGLQNVLGSESVAERRLSSSLRLAFSEADFRLTNLYAELKGWEQLMGLLLLAH